MRFVGFTASPRRARRLGVLLACAMTAICAGQASAQLAKNGGPIQVTAQKLDAFRNEGRYIYSGDVDAQQGDLRLRSATLTIICVQDPTAEKPAKTKANGEQVGRACDIDRLIAEKDVHYNTPNEKIVGDRAEYNYKNDTITVTGDVVLTRDGVDSGVIRGLRLVYDVKNGLATMTAGDKRVSSFFTQHKDNAAPAPSNPTNKK